MPDFCIVIVSVVFLFLGLILIAGIFDYELIWKLPSILNVLRGTFNLNQLNLHVIYTIKLGMSRFSAKILCVGEDYILLDYGERRT